jgi:hypothetical protein
MRKSIIATVLAATRGKLAGRSSVSNGSIYHATSTPFSDERVGATRRYLEYAIMPLWFAAGVADYICHRKTKIETTSGVTESFIHSLMMAEGGIPALAGLFLEVNAGMLGWSLAAFAAHQVTVLWDVAYAVKRRLVTPNEQHVHSALEMLPFCALSFLICLHWDQARALFGLGDEPAVKRLNWKDPPLPRAYTRTMLTTTGLLAALYAEELWRCINAKRQGLSGIDSPPAAQELFGSSTDRLIGD